MLSLEEHDLYDVNFMFPVRELDTEKLKLTPFIPRLHSESFYSGIAPHPEMFTYFPFPLFPTIVDFDNWVETRVRRDSGAILFAMIDKTAQSHAVAGIIGLIDTSSFAQSTEIGCLFTLPPFQRTHVTSTAVALLLSWCFEELRLRRVQWRCAHNNIASRRSAERFGFKKEVLNRWLKVAAPGKEEGEETRAGDPMPTSRGMHVLVLALYWDEWEAGGREYVRNGWGI
ncbi:acyl-CoA N-acyltransferase [Trametopsis cervina]|nr:acyl-CoA N-acyltransferase [Trametopsis cervina]